jgi:hypothetical protein
MPGMEGRDSSTERVGTLNGGYVRRVLLLQAPQIQSTDHVTCNVTITPDAVNTCYLGQVPRIPMWHDLSRLIASVPRTTSAFLACLVNIAH